jgi:hypothetical protein
MASGDLYTFKQGYKADPKAIAEILRSPSGPVVRDVIRRADLVLQAAKRQVRMGHVHAGMQGRGGGSRPNLRNTIVKRVVANSGHDAVVRVGSDLAPLALIHHEGTRPHTIVPRTATVLRFMPSGGGMVFTSRVNHPGTRPNRYLTDNLRLAGQK